MNQNVNLDLIPKFAVFGNLYFSQYDVGRTATINLLNGAEAYTIPVGATVKIQATKPSGLGFNETCTFSGNVVTVVSTETMTDEAGRIPCELQITLGDTILGTANFTFNVERSPHPEGTTDGTAESILNDITVAYNHAMDQIENAGGLTVAIKNALLNCFQKVAWIDENGQDYYDALADELFAVTGITLNSSTLLFNSLGSTQQLTASLIPSTSTATVSWESSDTSVATVSSSGLVTSVANGSATITASVGSVSATCSVTVSVATVTSISAVLNASGHTFYVGDPVDDIKPYLTVTATYSDSTTQTVPSGSYTLSGTLSQVGANTITVSYESVTTTVSVTCAALELSYISAVYIQSGTVYNTDTLDSLKSDLVVTAHYSDSTTSTVASADYTLSGTLTVGTSTITVTYLEKTTTFSVTVTVSFNYGIYTPDNVVQGKYIDDTGAIADATQNSGYIDDYIPIVKSSYWISYTNANTYLGSGTVKSGSNWRVSEYDADKTFIKQTHYSADTSTEYCAREVSFDANTEYIRLGWYNSSSTNVGVFEIENPDDITDLLMEVGDINSSTGQNTTSSGNIRIRTTGYVPASDTITMTGCPFGDSWSSWTEYGGFAFRCYGSDYGFLGSLTNSGQLFKSDISSVALPTGTAYVRIFCQYSATNSFADFAYLTKKLITINGTTGYYVVG